VAHFLRTGSRLTEPPLAMQKDILTRHYHAILEHFGDHAGVRLARKHVSWYSRGLPGSAEFRAAMNRLPDAASVLELIDAFYGRLVARGVSRTPPARDDLLAEAA
jgi:tRNA-dihydrouridine synthase B